DQESQREPRGQREPHCCEHGPATRQKARNAHGNSGREERGPVMLLSNHSRPRQGRRSGTPAVQTAMTLFADGREANIKSTIAMVEDVLLELGHAINDCRASAERDEQKAWEVKQGSATVRIALSMRDEAPHLRVISTVLTLTPNIDEAALFARLL